MNKWDKQMREIGDLERRLERDPKNLKLVKELWNAMAGGAHNLQSGGELIRIFRASALASTQAIVELSSAFRSLNRLTGETPRAELFDPDLRRAVLETAKRVDDSRVSWLLRFIDCSPQFNQECGERNP